MPMKKKISELELYEVDLLVAKAENLQELEEKSGETILLVGKGCFVRRLYHPTTNPSQAWPIIDREKINTTYGDKEVYCWKDDDIYEDKGVYGKTSLEAAMRYYLYSVYGEEVEL